MLEKIHCGQTGFIKNMGCHVNLLRIGELLLKNKISPYKESGIIFFDFKSAFDLVDHEILLEKVRKLELSEQTDNIITFCIRNSFIKIG